jgi:hypothetical protein
MLTVLNPIAVIPTAFTVTADARWKCVQLLA